MRCKNKQNEDCGLMPWERPDFCDELCEEYIPADLPEAGASAERISAVMHSADKSRLIKIAAELLTSVQLSDCSEDYKFKMPKYILRQIEKQSDRLREIAIELKEISDRIK